MKNSVKIIMILVTSMLCSCKSIYQIDYMASRTPFEDIEWNRDTPSVRINNVWYELLAIEDVPIANIVKESKKTFGIKWRERISEDLTRVLSIVGEYEFFDVQLQLIDKQTGKKLDMSVSLNAGEKRDALIRVLSMKEKVTRIHSNEIPERYKYLTTRIKGFPTLDQLKAAEQQFEKITEDDIFMLSYSGKSPIKWLSADRVKKSLDIMEYHIKERFSYADLRGVDYQMALDAIRASIGVGIHRMDLGIQFKKFLALFGDGHTRLSFRYIPIDKKDKVRLPFYMKKIERKIALMKSETTFYDNQYPFLKSIDGLDTTYLLKRTKKYRATDSKGQKRNLASYISFIYTVIRLEEIQKGNIIKKDSIAVVITDGKGSDKAFTVPLYHKRKKKKRKKKLSKAERELENILYRITPENVGYLKITEMEKRHLFMGELHKAMKSFKNTKGMIIDVRNNGGGNRRPTLNLLPYFIKEPRVINIAALRINKDINPGDLYHESYGLEKRFLHPRNSKKWTKEERNVIDKWLSTHKLSWNYNKDKFSKLHFCVVSPNQEAYDYDKPVVILMDDGCFSASDIFLGAFKGVKGVTLMGTHSRGGSGYSKSVSMADIHMRFGASRMASFKNNGDLYEGNGVIPDVYVEQKVEDLQKGVDTQYQKALEFIKNVNF